MPGVTFNVLNYDIHLQSHVEIQDVNACVPRTCNDPMASISSLRQDDKDLHKHALAGFMSITYDGGIQLPLSPLDTRSTRNDPRTSTTLNLQVCPARPPCMPRTRGLAAIFRGFGQRTGTLAVQSRTRLHAPRDG